MKGDAYKGMTTRSGTSNPTCIVNGTPCSPDEVATADLHAWSQNLHAPNNTTDFTPLLPGTATNPAKGIITWNAAEGAYSVAVQWSEIIDGSDTLRSLSVKVFP